MFDYLGLYGHMEKSIDKCTIDHFYFASPLRTRVVGVVTGLSID